ncbi:hypothetical protein [Reichenbachiella ulvae]|uniref:peptidylprolyl isomerase n=1 Tax=Reichenbachiella ulvae TaxID=2980104 RepID=A0ABT3CYT7_9BACT|nr:hypothetical protein [Reichenbachiella ulvae]MCV9388863.1 hypothetical protein [Reichenbachiella ulvae]
MMKSRDYLFFGVLAIIITIASCSNPVRDEEEAIQKAYDDSVAQAGVDETIIDDFWFENGYEKLELQAKDTATGLRYGVLDYVEGAKEADINDIVSIHYIGKFVDGEVFDTSLDTLAVSLDSIAWVERWKNYSLAENDFDQDILYVGEVQNDDGVLVPADTLDVDGFNTKEKLSSLNISSDPLDRAFYSASRDYSPITYNHTFNGTGISTNFVKGFRLGLHELTFDLSKGSTGVMIFPSAVGYGANGAGSIPPNTVISFEIIMANIRP